MVLVLLTLLQSLPVLGSPSTGGDARAALSPAGTLLPVQAVLVTLPAASARVTMLSAGKEEPTARPAALACVQTTRGTTLASQLQPVPVALMKDSLANNSTTRSGPVATRGPPLLTVMVEVMLAPKATGLGVLLLATRRSAPSRKTSTSTLPLLLPAMGSVVDELMLAVLVKVWPLGLTLPLPGAVATTVMLSAAPTGMLARVQLAVLPRLLQTQLGPLAETSVQPAGKVSDTTTLLAAAGPPLRGWMTKVTLAPATAGSDELTVF